MTDFDRPGFCALCHVEIAEFNGSDARGNLIISKLKGNADSIEVVLSDQSKMRVAVCLPCKDTFQPEDSKRLMQSVINGWAHEVSQLDWSEDRKISHMDKYSKLEITDRSDLKWNEGELKRLNKKGG